jgi:TM2 domain-containing membrane protein YozV
MPAAGKNPVVAVLLSCFIPGVGQFYNGDNKKGAIMLAVWFVSLILIVVAIGIFSLLAVWVYSMIDAYQVASGQKPVSA